jgi:hypothetical protein
MKSLVVLLAALVFQCSLFSQTQHMKVVNTVADMQRLNPKDFERAVYVISEGIFVWTPDSTASEDGTTVFKSLHPSVNPSAPGRWILDDATSPGSGASDFMLTPQMFGAVESDGIDDTTALLALAAAAYQNAHVYFPAGTYLHNQKLTFLGGVKLSGAHRSASTLLWNGGSTTEPQVQFGDPASFADAWMGYTVEDMRFNGNALAPGVLATNQLRGVFRNVWFYNHKVYGTRLNEAWSSKFEDCLWTSIDGDGLILSGASANKNIDGDFDTITGRAVYYEKPGNGDEWLRCSFQNISGTSMEIPANIGQAGVRLSGCYWEAVEDHFKFGETGTGYVGPVEIIAANFAFTGSKSIEFRGAIRSLTIEGSTIGPGMFISTNVVQYFRRGNYDNCCGASVTNNAQATFDLESALQPKMPNILVTNIAALYQLNLESGYVSNRFGIQVLFPQYPLHVVNSNGSVMLALLRDIGGSQYGALHSADPTGPYLVTQGAHVYRVYAAGNEIFFVGPDGIGVNKTPTVPLDIYSLDGVEALHISTTNALPAVFRASYPGLLQLLRVGGVLDYGMTLGADPTGPYISTINGHQFRIFANNNENFKVSASLVEAATNMTFHGPLNTFPNVTASKIAVFNSSKELVSGTYSEADLLAGAGFGNVFTNYQIVNIQVNKGTTTNITIDPLIQNWSWSLTTNGRFEFATNAITDTNKVYTVYIDIEASADGIQVTNEVDTLNAEGYWGELVEGLNTLTLTWKAGRWAVSQNTSKMDAALITGTIDSSASGLTVKLTDYKDFVYPAKVDGAGATILTNDYTSNVWGLTTHAGTGGTNVNYALYRIGTVPLDLDSAAAMTLKNLAIRVAGTDTASASFSIAYYSPASSAGHMPSDYTGLTGFVTFTTGTLTSAAANDIFYLSDATLTGWASGLTAGRPFIIGIARDGGDSNNDAISVVGGTIQFGRTQ